MAWEERQNDVKVEYTFTPDTTLMTHPILYTICGNNTKVILSLQFQFGWLQNHSKMSFKIGRIQLFNIKRQINC